MLKLVGFDDVSPGSFMEALDASIKLTHSKGEISITLEKVGKVPEPIRVRENKDIPIETMKFMVAKGSVKYSVMGRTYMLTTRLYFCQGFASKGVELTADRPPREQAPWLERVFTMAAWKIVERSFAAMKPRLVEVKGRYAAVALGVKMSCPQFQWASDIDDHRKRNRACGNCRYSGICDVIPRLSEIREALKGVV